MNFPDKKWIDPRLSDFDNADLYTPAMTLSPDRKKLALSVYSADMIDLFEIKNDTCIPLWSYCHSYPGNLILQPTENGVTPLFSEESLNGYIHNCSSNKYVYSLFSGKKSKEPDYAISNRIRVVSWDGKETFEYHLDRLISRITVSADDKVIYGIGKNEALEYEVIAFSTPKK